MSLYKKVKAFFPIGKLSHTAAQRIDDIYTQSNRSTFSNALQGLNARITYTVSFIPRLAIDTLASLMTWSISKAAQAVTSDDTNKTLYQERANKYRERFTKSGLALLAAPIGLFNPKVVSFYFIPKREKYGNILSGGHLHSVHPEIQYPKTIDELQKIVIQANDSGRKVTIIGAGRSQGQQFLPNDDSGVVISMEHFNHVQINADKKTVSVGAGATWGDIQYNANEHSLAVKVMQASNVFSIGGSISTNIHGWRKEGTVAETIRSLTIMDAQGNIRELNPTDELFQYVVGGYNQFGIILHAEIDLVNNERLVQKSINVTPANYFEYFKKSVLPNNNNRMHLYRLSLEPNNMLGEGVAVNYISTHKTRVQSTAGFHLEPQNGTRFQRVFVNLARRFGWIRRLYWKHEKNQLLQNEPQLTTNEIMQPPINCMFNNSLSESEWLQEFFVPGDNLPEFLNQLGSLLTENQVTVLNATVRYVKQDTVSKMGYANAGDRFAVVLCFNQLLNENEILKAKKWIRQAAELALNAGGTYYLPYQPFATQEQFSRAYPTAEAVYAKKLEVDPNQTFSSGFSTQYLAPKTVRHNAYKNLLATDENKQLFGQFLDNILDRVDKERFFPLLEDVVSYCDTPEEIYEELSKRINDIMPNIVGSTRRIFHSLSTIKHDLSEQVSALMKDENGLPNINGMIEIGYPGRFIKPIRERMNVSGEITIINDAQAASDVIQSGLPRPYDRFVPTDNYAPLDPTLFKDNSVDMITCFIGLHHIPDDRIEGFLTSLNRVLRPGGSFLLVDHDITDDRTLDMATLAHSIYNVVMGVSPEEERNEIRNFQPLGHWKALLAQYGFSVETATDKTMVREGDPTKNTMLRFVKKNACELKNRSEHFDSPVLDIERLTQRDSPAPVIRQFNNQCAAAVVSANDSAPIIIIEKPQNTSCALK